MHIGGFATIAWKPWHEAPLDSPKLHTTSAPHTPLPPVQGPTCAAWWRVFLTPVQR